MRKQIPNLITCMNVISGTLAIFLAMYGLLTAAAILILVGMVFDFFDGMTARLLHVKSEIGKELDSLADMVSFGVAPAFCHLDAGTADYSCHAGRDRSFLGLPLG